MYKKQRKQHRVGQALRLSAGEKRSRKQNLSMPANIERLELQRLRVEARCDLRFYRGDDGNLRVDVLAIQGALDAIVDTEGAFDFVGQEQAA